MTLPTLPLNANVDHDAEVADAVTRFQQLFNTLSAGNVAGLAEVYREDIRFADPFGHVEGLSELQAYFEKIYTNVRACRFDFSEVIVSGDQACLAWVMHLQHPKLRHGRELAVHGMSHLTVADGRVLSHRDYFDGAELLYGNLPVIGPVVRWIRSYAS